MRFYTYPIKSCLLLILPLLIISVASPGQETNSKKEAIKFGLLIPDRNSPAARYGAELAVKYANQKGGVNGVPVCLITGTMEGPWGTGSKEAVKMIFDENVVAILGSHDGRNAHLVEQVSAKSRVVFLSAWSGDPTLAQAFVPWFFNCVFNDIQVSDALIDEIFNKRDLHKIAVISDDSYDSGSTLKNFLKKTENSEKPVPVLIKYNDTFQDLKEITDRLKKEHFDCIILLVQSAPAIQIIEQLRQNNLHRPVFATLNQLDENKIPGLDYKYFENVMLASSEIFSGKLGESFVKDYRKQYGNDPGAVAAYAFDGMNILIDAVRKAGTEREGIQKALREIKYVGVTGTIQFDANGNRKGTPVFVEIRNGIPVIGGR
ncbi:MAG: ABC transporter substrate-binding protein [Bacteroidales bacterium]|nr:ABC transporter substrate-binding protein [Bacteroidales bacterium]